METTKKTLCTLVSVSLLTTGVVLPAGQAFAEEIPEGTLPEEAPQAIEPVQEDSRALAAPEINAYSSAFNVSSCNMPVSLTKGEAFKLTGTLNATEKMNCVTVGVADLSGNFLPGHYVSLDPRSTTYDLAAAGTGIKFDTLPEGQYQFIVWGRGVSGANQDVLVKNFTVVKGSEFALSGCNVPASLVKGSNFSVAGTLNSNLEMNCLTVGVTDSAGNFIQGSYTSINPRSTGYNLENLSSAINFSTLPVGNYEFVVWARDVSGGNKDVYKQNIRITSSSSFTATGCTAPSGVLMKGQRFDIAGTVTSSAELNCLTVGVADKNGNFIKGSYTSLNPKAKTYDLGGLASLMNFEKLPAGEYQYIVWARDITGDHKDVFVKKFTVSDGSEFNISSCNIPDTLKRGSSFNVAGTVTSKQKMNCITVGVTDASGNFIKGSYASIDPRSTSYDLANVSSQIKFEGLPTGNYQFLVWVRDESGANKDVYKKSFTVSKGADLSFSGCVAPGALLKGESFQVKGVVSADEQLNCVTAGVMNSSGTFIPGSYVSVDPQSDRYDLGNTGKAIDFSRLPAGEYTYAVWARTVSGDHMYLFTKKISVSEFSTSNVTAPTTLTQGSSFVLSGSVSSTFNMSRVIVGIKAEGDYWLPGKYVVHTPNSTSYDLASADKYISFGSLPAGTYYYTIYTEDVRGAETKAYSKSFTVGSGSESASGNILSYNASVIRDIGRQPYSGPCGIYAMAYCRA
ncbi:MAG: hypothetical protein RR472_03485, partial [Anaerovoracaceae bacterium]